VAKRAPTLPNLKERLRLGIAAHKRLLGQQEQDMKRLVEADPEYALRAREQDRAIVSAQITELQALIKTCVPYISRIKPYVSKITDETVDTAAYLLFSQMIQHFEAILLLATDGLSIEANELIRAIGEARDLIVLFLVEGKDHSNLKKWFEGEIISNDIARKAAHRFLNERRTDPLPVHDMKSGIYTALSKYSHMSYAAILESIDVFARDFDWHHVAGFHYTTVGSLPQAKEMVRATVVALKQFYLFHGDTGTFAELDALFNLISQTQ
jgi:hypothetical protein